MKNYTNPVYISFDEWGIMSRNFLTVLPIAQSFNSFIRHADIVKMTNFTMLTSLLSTDKDKGSYKTPLFYTFKLFSNNCYGNSIDTYVQCDTFNTEKYKGIPYLDVSAVYNKETKTVFINVVNRHKEKSIVTEIRSISGIYTGKAEASVLNCESLDAPFTFEKQEQYKPVIKEIKVEENNISYSFPPHSFTQIKVAVKKVAE
jgi:alpha-N-arabinofuranosidase